MQNWEEMTFAHRLKVACQIRRMTLRQAAQLAGVSQDTVYQASIGRHITKVDTIQRLARVLGVRTGWLLEGEGEIFRPEMQRNAGAGLAPASLVRESPLFSELAKVLRAESDARVIKRKTRPSVSAAAIRDLDTVARKVRQMKQTQAKRRKS